MATTTNYSWTTPDDTDYVKDGASAIRSLGSAVDTTTKALNPSTTLGDVEYRSATADTNTRLAIGTSGQVLTVSAGVPAWVTPGGVAGLTNFARGTASISTGTTVTLPTSRFSNAPTVLATITSSSGMIIVTATTTTNFTASAFNSSGAAATRDIAWMAAE